MDNSRLDLLFNKYLLRQCTPAEVEEFVHMLDEQSDGGDDSQLSQPMKDLWQQMKDNPKEYNVNWSKMYSKVVHTDDQLNVIDLKPKRKLVWIRYAAAAVLLLAIATTYMVVNNKPSTPSQQTVVLENDATPGGNRATLTLADGSTIVLDDAKNGNLANQEGAVITKTQDGQLIYNASNKVTTSSLTWNTVSTPRGGQYQVILPDGSRVWLNAASSIKFPTAFTSPQRKVEITGEAYFEVAHDATKPFQVLAGGHEVEVLGTHFNVNAYTDEDAIKTTLLSGSVKVSVIASTAKSATQIHRDQQNNRNDGGKQSVVLKPGQQSIAVDSRLTIHNSPDIDEVMAWKNGLFNFSNVDIREIMRQAARWYDVEVKYTGTISNEKYSGKISRNTNLSQLLGILEFSGVKWKIEGKTVTITN